MMRARALWARRALSSAVLTPWGTAVGQMPGSGGVAGVTEALVAGALVLLAGLALYLTHGWYRRRAYAYLYRVSTGKWDWRKLTGRDCVRITADFCRLGRHPCNEVQLRDRSISRFHAYIVRHGNGAFSIYDAGSTNGVRVGYRHVQSGVLSDGELVDLGDVRFKFTRLPRDYKVHGDTQVVEIPGNRYDSRRRRRSRADVILPVRLYNDDFGWINGWLRNAGREGAYVDTDTKLATRLPLDVVVPVTKGPRRKWLRVSAEVVWSDPRGCGVRFTDADAVSIDQLISMSMPTESTPAEDRLDPLTVH